MQFTARDDIAAPIEKVFAAVTDFETFERTILRRGGEIERTDTLQQPGVGMAWKIGVEFRGKDRTIDATITQFDRPELLEIMTHSAGIDGHITVELLQLSPRQTRLQVVTALKPTNMPARFLLQTLRLAKTSLLRRYRRKIRKFARDLEARVGVVKRGRV